MPTAPESLSGRLRVSVFGGPILRDESGDIPLSLYQAALVGLVYGHGGAGVSRSRLIWLLWEEDDTSQSRHRLSQLLYAVTRKFDQEALFVVRGEAVSSSDRVESDLIDFEDFLRRKRVGPANALLQREAHAARVAPTREMEDWKAAKMMTLRSRLRDTAAQLWSESENTANWTAAREAAETLFALDPQSESYLRCLMKARALCGAPEEAEAAYRSWADLVPPSVSAKAVDLLAALETWRQRSPSFQASVTDPPFVGREAETATLRRDLKPPPASGVRIVLVTGEAGIGKTRLGGEVCRELIAEGTTVVRSTCSPLAQEIPLSPFLDILRDKQFGDALNALEEPWRSVILDLVPERGTNHVETPYIEPSAVAPRLFEAVRRLISEISSDGAVLWIDDLQWVDHTTAAALDFAMRRWDRGRLTLLLSARTLVQSTGSSGHLLINSVRSRASVVELGELASDDAMFLAASVLGERLQPRSRAHVLALTGNVPLYIVEVAHELAEGRLVLEETGDSAGPVPVRIQEVVDERLSLLQPVQRWILELIAVGIRLHMDVIAATIKESEGVLLDALDRLMALRLITTEKGMLSCKHDLIRQGIYGAMTPLKQTVLHRRIAESLLSIGPGHDPSQLALHFDRGGMPPEAFRFARAAADRAEDAGAAHEAIRFLRVARRNCAEQTEVTRLLAREANVLVRQAEISRALPLLTIAEQEFREQGNRRGAVTCGIKRVLAAREGGALEHGDALEALNRILEDCVSAGLWDSYVEAVEAKLGIVEIVNDIPEMQASLSQLHRIPTNSDERVECLASLLRALGILFGNGDGALAAAQDAYRSARQYALHRLEDLALHRLCFVHTMGGTLNSEGGAWILDEALRLATRGDHLKRRYRLLEIAGVWNLECGDFDAAEGYLKQAEEFVNEAPEFLDRVHIFGNLGELSAMRGQFDTALEYYSRAHAALRPQDPWRLKQITYGGLGYSALELGDLRLARECETKLEYALEAYFDPWIIVLFQTTLLKRRGAYDEAIDYLGRLSTVFEDRLRMVVIKMRLLECRLCQGRKRDRARELVDWLLGETGRLKLRTRHKEAEVLAAGLEA